MKAVFIIERTDTRGEFQPFGSIYFTRETASGYIATLPVNKTKYRIMQYIRKMGGV